MLPSLLNDLPSGHQFIQEKITILPPAKPSYRLCPGHVDLVGRVVVELDDGEEKSIQVTVIRELTKKTWANIDDSRKETIINDHDLIYFKTDQNGNIVEIGMHVSTCRKMDEWGIKRIIFGACILPPDTLVRALPDTSYANMIEKFMTELT